MRGEYLLESMLADFESASVADFYLRLRQGIILPKVRMTQMLPQGLLLLGLLVLEQLLEIRTIFMTRINLGFYTQTSV